MDKNTLSNYGWIVIAVLVLSVMIALATPFGEYVENAVWSVTEGLFDTSENALNIVGMSAKTDGTKKVSGSFVVLNDVSPQKHNLGIRLSSDSITDFSSITVTRCGKNLWDKEYASNVDNWESLDNFYYVIPIKVGKGNTITISYKNDIEEGISLNTAVLNKKSADTAAEVDCLYHQTLSAKTKRVITLTAVEDNIYIKTQKPYMGGGDSRTFARFQEYISETLQIEIGTIETQYESFNKQTAISNADGLVEGLTSVSPVMSLYTNIDGVSISVEYNTLFNKAESPLKGKRLVVCGDSITEGINPDGGYFKSYAEIVADKYDMEFTNKGVSGMTMGYGQGKSFSINLYKMLPSSDYITLWFGWNDGAYSTLGTINDTDDTTFYGAYKKTLDYITAQNPNAKIGLIVPYGNIPEYQQAVRDIAQLYELPCLDVTDFDRATLTYDNCHPNQAGYEYLSELYEQFLLSL